MRRRRFIQTLTGFAMNASPAMMALEALRQSIAHAIGSDCDRWNELAANYGTAFYKTSADEMYQRLSVDLGVLGQLMSVEPDDPDLERAAAGLAMVMAITLTFVGGGWSARRWWATARRAADKSNDLDMQIMTRSQDAVKGLYDGRPLHDVLRLAERTLALAGRRICPGTAGVLAGRAQTLAISGRHVEAVAAVQAVEVMTDRMPRAALRDESMFGWPEHRLRHTQSFVFTEIGDTVRAMRAQDRALKLYPDTHTSNRSMVEMHRASCLIRDGHIGDGLRHAADVLDALPAGRHDQLIHETVRRALAVVPTRERQRPEFVELRDRTPAPPGR